MKKVISLWGLLSGLFICLIIAYFQEPIKKDNPIEWEPIPEIVDTVEIEATPVHEHEHIIHYEPIKPDYECREFTQEEAQLLMRIAEAESGNQGISGMMLVMQVVFNRVEDPTFPDSIEGVIFQAGQFETVNNNTFYEVELSPEVHLALAEIEKGIPYDEQIIGFETAANGRTLERYFCYAYSTGDHDFYVSR